MGVPDIVATLLLKLIDTPLGMLGVHAIEVFSVSEQVVVRVYSMFVIAVDIDTVCESDPLAEVRVPEIVHDTVGHVPQIGLLAFVKADPLEKPSGSDKKLLTHEQSMREVLRPYENLPNQI